MIKVNMHGAGWGIPPGNVNKPVEPDNKEPVPTRCEFCIVPICEGDEYYIGYDVHMIFAMTCTDDKCKQWLEYKAKRKKPWTL